MSGRGTDPLTRLLSRIEVTQAGCWEWLGNRSTHGYGRISIEGRLAYVHRVAYEYLVGPIPKELHCDHLCRNRACCNPEHIEPVEPRVNILRGVGMGARNVAVIACPQGHPYEGDNLYLPPSGDRLCRECRRVASLAYYHRRRASRDLAEVVG